MRILALIDDRYHPGRVPREGLEALPGGPFEFDWIADARDWSPGRMAVHPLVILAKSNHVSASEHSAWMSEGVQAAFVDYVRRGKGLLAVHSGTAGYGQAAGLRRLLGGVFTHHPKQCPVTVEPRAGHPLCAGSDPFTLVDEHYFVALDDPHAEVFATTRSGHGEAPGAWRRTEGAGRVATLTPGHNPEVWRHPSFQALLTNAIRWCGGEV
jgi:type 1 glutamine amidotransferase